MKESSSQARTLLLNDWARYPIKLNQILQKLLEGVPYFGPLLSFIHKEYLVSNSQSAFKALQATISDKDNDNCLDVISLTANNFDHYLSTENSNLDQESNIKDDSFYSAGGSGANTLCGLAHLGLKTAVIGCINDDENGHNIEDSFKLFSVDIKLLLKNKNIFNARTGKTSVIVTDSGHRTIFIHPNNINNYINKLISEKGAFEDICRKISNSKIFHISSFATQEGLELTSKLLKCTKESGTIISFKPGDLYIKKGLDGLTSVLAYTNIIFLSENQFTLLLQSTNSCPYSSNKLKSLSLNKKVKLLSEWRKQKNMRHPMIIVVKKNGFLGENTLNPQHIFIASFIDGEIEWFNSIKIQTKVENNTSLSVDMTGVCDAIATGLLYGLLCNKSLEKSAQYALNIAACVSSKFGARNGLPNNLI